MKYLFNHFKGFAGSILADPELLQELAKKYLALARENNLPLLKFYSSLPEADQLETSRKGLEEFLTVVISKDPLEDAIHSLEQWREDKLPGIPNTAIKVQDIVLIYSIRKQLFLRFLPVYTQDINLFSQIVLELEAFHQKVEQYAFEVFFDIQQEALLKEKELSESVINNSEDGIMAFDKEERIVLWNKKLEERYGRKKEDVLGKSFFEIYPSLKGTEEGGYLARALKGETVLMGEQPNPFRQGWFEARIIPLHDKAGKVFGAVSIVHDVTRRKESLEAIKNQQEEIEAGNKELNEKQKKIDEAFEKLKDQEYFISAVTGSVPEMIFIYDIVEDRNIYSNSEITRVLGYSPEEFKAFGKGLLKRNVHPDDWQIVEERNSRYTEMKEGDIADATFRYKNKTGDYRYIRTKSRIYRFTPEGKPWQVLGVTEDVTDKVQQEETLRKSRDYYLTILDDFPSLIWRSNTEGLCDYFNKSWLKFSGRTYEQEYGNGWAEGVHPDDFDMCLDIYTRNFKAKTPFQMEYRMKRYDGVYRWIIDYGKPMYSPAGDFTGFLGACFDIQDRKNFEREIQNTNDELSSTLEELRSAQEQLTESNSNLEQRVQKRTEQLEAGEKQLRLLTDALPTLISYLDRDLIYRFVNKTYSLWFGKTKEEIEGKHAREIIGEAVFNKIEQHLHEALSGKEVRTEGFMEYKYGRSKTVSVNFIPYHEDGEVKGIYALIYDISEIRKVQQSLETALSDITDKNSELTRINNDLDNFIYAASHDLKSPVLNMEGILRLLEKTLTGKTDEKEEQLFKLMDTSVNKLKTTISYLTDVTKISKNIEEAREVISVPAIMEEVRNHNQNLTEAVNPLVRENYEVETLEFVRGNFYSIVLNLFTNAIKFRSPERPLEIAVSTYTESDSVVLEVKDNGLGLSAEKQQNVFKLFKRMHSHIEGSGVGLYIVKRIAENCGGRVEVGGAENEGAVFRVFLPKTLMETSPENTFETGKHLS